MAIRLIAAVNSLRPSVRTARKELIAYAQGADQINQALATRRYGDNLPGPPPTRDGRASEAAGALLAKHPAELSALGKAEHPELDAGSMALALAYLAIPGEAVATNGEIQDT